MSEWDVYVADAAVHATKVTGHRIDWRPVGAAINGVPQEGHYQVNGISSFVYQEALSYLMGLEHGYLLATTGETFGPWHNESEPTPIYDKLLNPPPAPDDGTGHAPNGVYHDHLALGCVECFNYPFPHCGVCGDAL